MAAGERPAFEPRDDWRIEFEPRGRKREGSQAFQRYEKYKKAKTIGDFYALGGRKVDLQNDFTKEKKTPTKEDVLCRSCPTKEDVVDVFLGATCRPALGLCGAKSGQLWAIVGLCLANLVHVVGI